MLKTKSNLFKRISILMVSILLVISSCLAVNFSSQNNCVLAEDFETGLSLISSFQVSYYQDEKITINNKETTEVPDFTNGVLKVVYELFGDRIEKNIDMKEAYLNGELKTHDYLEVSGFSTKASDLTDNMISKVYTMKITLVIVEGTNETFDLDVDYIVYKDANSLKSTTNTIKILNTINEVLKDILTPIIVVVTSIGAIFAIFLGIKMAKANNAEERDEAKKRVIATLVAIAIGILLIIMFQLFAQSSESWFGISGHKEFFNYMPTRK